MLICGPLGPRQISDLVTRCQTLREIPVESLEASNSVRVKTVVNEKNPQPALGAQLQSGKPSTSRLPVALFHGEVFLRSNRFFGREHFF